MGQKLPIAVLYNKITRADGVIVRLLWAQPLSASQICAR